MNEIHFKDLYYTGKYIIQKLNTNNTRFSGMGIMEENIIEVIRATKHLIHFKISMTEMFARRSDIDMILEKIQ